MNNMNFIPMQILEYRFNDQGITEQIMVALQHYQGNEQINARVSLNQEYVTTQNPKLELDAMNKDQIETYARRKIREWIMVERPEVEPEPEVDPEGEVDPVPETVE